MRQPTHWTMNGRFIDEQRRVLELLAGAEPHGCTEAALSALGCRVETLAAIVRTGLASMTLQRMTAGGRIIEVARLKIIDAGRRAIMEASRT